MKTKSKPRQPNLSSRFIQLAKDTAIKCEFNPDDLGEDEDLPLKKVRWESVLPLRQNRLWRTAGSFEDFRVVFIVTHSNCGTMELRNIHEKDHFLGDLNKNSWDHFSWDEAAKLLTQQILHNLTRANISNFVYYAPKSHTYKPIVNVLTSLGFKKVYTFQHQGYLDDSHQGWTDVYTLSFTKVEKDFLNAIQPAKKAVG